MENEIISYLEMCRRESSSLQRGMNFELGSDYAVILMSVHPNAPYRDCLTDNGSTVIYEGHDVPRSRGLPDPKTIDQSERNPSGALTENGKFYQAALQFKAGAVRFKLEAVESDVTAAADSGGYERRRLIPTAVKDGGMEARWRQVRLCGAADELHFDHDLPYSFGGTSISAANIQLLCARHNLAKGARIL